MNTKTVTLDIRQFPTLRQRRANENRLAAWQYVQQQRLDEVNVVNLRAYASRLWARYPHMTEDSIKHALSEETERRGYTQRELRAACLNLQYVRDDFETPNTLRTETIEQQVERAR